MAEYQQALFKCLTKVSRREFKVAIATKHQQLAHIDLVLWELQHQTISAVSFNVKHPLELNLEQAELAAGWNYTLKLNSSRAVLPLPIH